MAVERTGKKLFQRGSRPRLARLPGGAKSLDPLDAWSELQFVERERFRPAPMIAMRRLMWRRWQREGGRHGP